jgi:hypothetical protein
MDASGRLLPSLEISGVAVIPQAEARKALVMNCPQMIKLENQKLLARIQEGGSRHVWYRVTEVQKLLNLIDRGGADPELADDDDVTDGGGVTGRGDDHTNWIHHTPPLQGVSLEVVKSRFPPRVHYFFLCKFFALVLYNYHCERLMRVAIKRHLGRF